MDFLNILSSKKKLLGGLSILFVIMFHAHGAGLEYKWLKLFCLGFTGVDVFLLLSGFGCGFSYSKNSLKEFYVRRIKRVWPIFILWTVVAIWLFPSEGHPFSLFDWLCNLTTLSYWGVGGKAIEWYLSALIFLYLVYPLLFEFVKRLGKWAIVIAFIVSEVLVWFANLDFNIFLLVVRLPIFLFGIYCFFIVKSKMNLKLKIVDWCVYVMMCGIALITHITGHDTFRNILLSLLTPIMIVFIMAVIDKFKTIFQPTFRNIRNIILGGIQYVGQYSLELYASNGITLLICRNCIAEQSQSTIFILYILLEIVIAIALIMFNNLIQRFLSPSSSDSSPRIPSIDILKGLMVIAVVIGHINNTVPGLNMFWFHMPAFFMISGFLFSQKNIEQVACPFVLKQARKYVVPYVAWLLLFYMCFGWSSGENVLHYLRAVIYGGGTTNRPYSYATWFINALFIASLLFWLWRKVDAMTEHRYGSKVAIRGGYLLLLVIYVWMHIDWPYWNKDAIPLPWALDTVPGALFFMQIGWLLRKLEQHNLQICVMLVPLVFVTVHEFLGYDWIINMQSCRYDNWWLDAILPISFTCSFYIISQWLVKVNVLSQALQYVGKSSIVIFFTHLAVCFALRPWAEIHRWETIAVCVSVGCLLFYISEKTKTTSKLFLGKW